MVFFTKSVAQRPKSALAPSNFADSGSFLTQRRLSPGALPAMGEIDSTASGNEGTVIGVTIIAAHAERVRAREPSELRDTGVAPPAPLTVSPRLLAEVCWSTTSVGMTLARRPS